MTDSITPLNSVLFTVIPLLVFALAYGLLRMLCTNLKTKAEQRSGSLLVALALGLAAQRLLEAFTGQQSVPPWLVLLVAVIAVAQFFWRTRGHVFDPVERCLVKPS